MPTSNLNLSLSLYISLPHIASNLRGIIHWSYRRATVHCIMLPARNYPAVTHEQSAINLQFKSNTKSALHTAGNNAYHSVSQCVPSQRNALSRTTTWHNLLYPIQYTSSHDRLIPIAQNDLLGLLYAQDGLTPCASYWYDHRHPVTLWISTDLARKSSKTFWDVSKTQNPKRSKTNMGKSPSMSPIRLFLGMFTRVSGDHHPYSAKLLSLKSITRTSLSYVAQYPIGKF